jgi:hypothetical protein
MVVGFVILRCMMHRLPIMEIHGEDVEKGAGDKEADEHVQGAANFRGTML